MHLFINGLQDIIQETRKSLHIRGTIFGHSDFGFSIVCQPSFAGVCFAERSEARHQTMRVGTGYGETIRKRFGLLVSSLLLLGVFVAQAGAQTDCADGSAILDMTPPKAMTPEELIQKFTTQETKLRELRTHYSYTQDVLVQTLDGTAVDGQFHQITQVSYDDKGKRLDNVTYSEEPTMRIKLSATDMEDIRVFMPWILTTDEVAQYNLTYAGQQHVDDLDTYVFHVVPKKEEKNTRYFQGRIWVDNRDLQIVKLCGKSVPDAVHVKKNQTLDIRPTFVGYRQFIDANWFPAYARVDDTLHFGVQSIHVREIVKFTGYKRVDTASTASKP